MFIVGLFNLPSMGGLVLSLNKSHAESLGIQKKIKLLLKIGVAKSFGGLFVAIFMGLRYLSLDQSKPQEEKQMYRNYAVLLGYSAIVDVVYSLLSSKLIKRTRAMCYLIKKSKYRTQKKLLEQQSSIPSSTRSSKKSSPKMSPSKDLSEDSNNSSENNSRSSPKNLK